MDNIYRSISLLTILFLLVQCQVDHGEKSSENSEVADHAVRSLRGQLYYPADPSEASLENFQKAKVNFEKNLNDLDNLIWYGRRTAYLGRYADAISIYTQGLSLHPDEPRLYRHRGHRYISIREYDKAITDLSKAAELIEGKEDQIEPDGLPNKLNIPLSTLHGNIWYHLGLAHYLKHDFEASRAAYERSLDSGQNDDNIVSNSHWLYMINRRLGDEKMARAALDLISDSLNVIENHSYYDLCRFYKGLIPRDSLLAQDGSPAGDAMAYGLANWDFYQGDLNTAEDGFSRLMEKGNWASFGFLAAEKDLAGLR